MAGAFTTVITVRKIMGKTSRANPGKVSRSTASESKRFSDKRSTDTGRDF
jgi:hypothetical protein